MTAKQKSPLREQRAACRMTQKRLQLEYIISMTEKEEVKLCRYY